MSAIKFAFRFGSVLFNASSFTLPPVLVRTADQKKTHTHTHMHTQMKRDLIRPWNTSSTFSLLQTGTMPRQLLACHHCLCRSASRVYSCHDSPVLFVLYARTCACVFACGCTSSFLPPTSTWGHFPTTKDQSSSSESRLLFLDDLLLKQYNQ